MAASLSRLLAGFQITVDGSASAAAQDSSLIWNPARMLSPALMDRTTRASLAGNGWYAIRTLAHSRSSDRTGLPVPWNSEDSPADSRTMSSFYTSAKAPIERQ